MTLNMNSAWVAVLGVMGIIAVTTLASFAPKLLIVGVGVSVFIGIFLRWRRIALAILFISCFFDENYISLGFALIGYGDIGLFIFLSAWLFERLFYLRQPLRLPRGWALLIAYLFCVGLSLFLGPTPSIAYGQYVRHCLYVLSIYAFVDYVRSSDQLLLCIKIFIGCALIHSIIALSIENPNARLVGIVGQANTLGMLIGIGVILAFSTLSETSPSFVEHLIIYIALSIMIIALILTASRGSYLSCTLSIFWIYRTKWRSVLTTLIIATLIVYLVEWLEPDRYHYIIKRLNFQDQSINNRQAVYFNAIKLIQNHPWFGIGFGQFTLIDQVIQVDQEGGRGSHNYYLGLMASSGLISAAILFYFILIQARGVWKGSRYSRVGDLRFKGHRSMIFSSFQVLLIFQSISMISRGHKRIVDWIPLAIYCVLRLYLEELMNESERSTRESQAQQSDQRKALQGVD